MACAFHAVFTVKKLQQSCRRRSAAGHSSLGTIQHVDKMLYAPFAATTRPIGLSPAQVARASEVDLLNTDSRRTCLPAPRRK